MSAWVDGAVTLLPFPYLRVGVLLAYGVSGISGLRRRFRLPFVVRHPFPVSVVLHLFWGWGGLVTCLWPPPATPGFWTLLMLGCAVLTPWPLDAPSPFVAVDFFLGRLFGLGLVGRVRASVPTFFWWCSLSRVLGSAWRLWPLGGLAPAVFLGLTLGSSLSLPVLAAGLRWLRFILSGPPSVASLWSLLPWLFVRYLLACPRGAAVPLDSWVLWCS